MHSANHMDPRGPQRWSGKSQCSTIGDDCCGSCDPLAPLDWLSGFWNKLKPKTTHSDISWNGLRRHEKGD